MNDELMFQLATQLTAAKIQAHFISPSALGVDAWTEDQIEEHWKMLRRLWREGHKEDTVRQLEP